MRTQHSENQTNRQQYDSRNVPKREPARTLWLCDLTEWQEFQAGKLSAEELKRRCSTGEQVELSRFGGDAE